jgi:hypothetical protein
MSPITVGLLVFALAFGSVLAGIGLRAALPVHHFSEDSKKAVNSGVALIATMTALVLGLITASAKSNYDQLDATVRESAVNLMKLNEVLVRIGPESEKARAALRDTVAVAIEANWPDASSSEPRPEDTSRLTGKQERVFSEIRMLPEQTAYQQWLKAHALDMAEGMRGARWAMVASMGTSVPAPFLVVLVFWLVVIFVSFGLVAPRNGTVIVILFACALSVASAIVLVLEMDGPFSGMIRISPDPLKFVLSRMGE